MSIYQPVPKRGSIRRKCPALHPHFITAARPLGNRLALFLCERCKYGSKRFTGSSRSINILFLKVHADAKRLQLTHSLQAVLGIARKARDGFDKDAVNTPFPRILQHPLEILSFGYRSAGDSLICIDIDEIPIRIADDKFREVGVLRGIGVELVIGIRADASISCYAELPRLSLRCSRDRDKTRRGRHCQRADCFLAFAHSVPPLFSDTQYHVFLKKAIPKAEKYQECFAFIGNRKAAPEGRQKLTGYGWYDIVIAPVRA